MLSDYFRCALTEDFDTDKEWGKIWYHYQKLVEGTKVTRFGT